MAISWLYKASKVDLGRLGCGFNYVSGSGFGKAKTAFKEEKYEELSHLEKPDFLSGGRKASPKAWIKVCEKYKM